MSEPPTSLWRYPAIEAPAPAIPGNAFNVQISLQLDSVTPDVVVAEVGNGVSTRGQAMNFSIPCVPDCQMQVILSTPDLELLSDDNTATITMKQGGSSTPANFRVRLPTGFSGHATRISATFWYQGQFLARAWRSVPVGNARSATPALAPKAQAVSLPFAREAPDLTIRWEEFPEARNSCQVTVSSPHLAALSTRPCKPSGELQQFLQQRFGRMIGSFRGVAPVQQPGAKTIEEMRGLGIELNQFLPTVVQDAFWNLVDMEKSTPSFHFRTIEIQTNSPGFPWELLVPVRNGESYPGFLSTSFIMARWHIDDAVRDIPPTSLELRTLAAIVPRYRGARSLDHQEEEMEELKRLPGFAEIEGDTAGLRSLLKAPPEGVVHFAGHGSAASSASIADYDIHLEDGDFNPTRWLSFMGSQPGSHPLYFLNACETGQESNVAGLVDGWANAILRSGASGFIGGLWSLSDSGAAAFAEAFYENIRLGLESGRPVRVADAVLDARKKLLATGDPTILAYVYYGDLQLELYRTR